MEELPEVVGFVISKASTSGKKLSWSVWDNGEATTVKLLWKPDVAWPLSNMELSFATSTPSIYSGFNIGKKKRRSPSNKKRSEQRL